MVGKSSRDIVLSETVVIDDIEENPRLFKPINIYKDNDIQNISDRDFEKLLYKRLPKKTFNPKDLSEEHTLENFKETRVGKALFENQKEKMKRLLDEENVNIAIKVMMDLQKPIKKFYEKAGSPFTKEMVDEFIYIAKNNLDYEDCEFYNLYIKQITKW